MIITASIACCDGLFDNFRKYSADPMQDQLRLWDIIVFNYLIDNTDAHVKNYSLLYGPNLKGIRLAPAYDIVSTTVYEQSTRDMAFSIGDAYSIDEIGREHFQKAAKEVGIGERMAMRRLDGMCARFRIALRAATEALVQAGYPKTGEMEERILQIGGVKKFRSV